MRNPRGIRRLFRRIYWVRPPDSPKGSRLVQTRGMTKRALIFLTLKRALLKLEPIWIFDTRFYVKTRYFRNR